MSKKVLVNNVEYVLPLEADVEVAVEFSPFKPASYSNTMQSSDSGQNVTRIADGVYLRHWYDHSNVSQTFREDWFDEETGEWQDDEWQEWVDLEKDEYTLVITQPEVVGKSLDEFAPRERARYRLAKIVRESTGKVVTTKWNVHVVDVLPEIEHRSISTPANTSNVSWGGQRISETVLLRTVDGWTGDRDDTKRDVFVLRSEWADVAP